MGYRPYTYYAKCIKFPPTNNTYRSTGYRKALSEIDPINRERDQVHTEKIKYTDKTVKAPTKKCKIISRNPISGATSRGAKISARPGKSNWAGRTGNSSILTK